VTLERVAQDGMRVQASAVAAWRRQWVGTAEAHVIYRKRAATAECANAHSRNRALSPLYSGITTSPARQRPTGSS